MWQLGAQVLKLSASVSSHSYNLAFMFNKMVSKGTHIRKTGEQGKGRCGTPGVLGGEDSI